MAILLPIVGITFAALCVWLTVRIINRREWWAKWTGVVLAIGIPICAYLGSYALMVNPFEIGTFSAGFYHGRITPLYALPGRSIDSIRHAFWQWFFGPANAFDRAIRADLWRDVSNPRGSDVHFEASILRDMEAAIKNAERRHALSREAAK